MDVVHGEKSKKNYVEHLGTKVKKLWKLKRKGIGKENFEKKMEEFEGVCSRARIGRGRKRMENFGGIWEKFRKIDEGIEVKGKNLVNLGGIRSETGCD